MKKISIALLFLFYIFSLHSLEQSQLNDEINNYLVNTFEKLPIPGFSVVVANERGVIFSSGYGVEVEGTAIAMSDMSINAIGSLTKSFTAIAVLQLVDRGLVDLDTAVVEYIPWFRTLNKDLSDLITVRMLLNNSSGLPSVDDFHLQVGRDKNGIEKGIRRLASVSIDRYPGETFEYSNEGWNLLGLIIETVTDITYAEYMEKEVLTPMEMNRSTTDMFNIDQFYSDGELTGGHSLGISKGIPSEINYLSGGVPAGLFFRSNARDLGNYLETLLNDGKYKGKEILSKKGFELLWKPTVSFPGLSHDEGGTGELYYYCMGWMKSRVEGRDIIHHGGNINTMSSKTLIDPIKKIAVSILYNVGSGLDPYRFPTIDNIGNNILHIVAGEEKTSFAIPVKADPNQQFEIIYPKELEDYYGTFINGRRTIEIYEENGKLILKHYMGTFLYNISRLDFINRDQVVLQSLANTKIGLFKRGKSGYINSFVLSGKTFSYRQDDPERTAITSSDYKYQFSISGDKLMEFSGNIGKAKFTDKSGLIVLSENYISPDRTIKQHIGFQSILTEGYIYNREVNSNSWNQQSFKVEKEGLEYVLTVLSTTKNKDSFTAIFYAPIGGITDLITEQASTIISTFEWLK